ncbi:uncharacterized protein LOC125801540 isoform X5 [Astyanax mexicanus]|uniref:uncharacterized protein LOC125801540 isoform X5 n=1 Tax=Astyanax mexicanus TaxID=7994 RepID=UPI0020CAF918|nr:uncharacterized protein LOC125801540 isoform X5 [Astyanax mexicanus]
MGTGEWKNTDRTQGHGSRGTTQARGQTGNRARRDRSLPLNAQLPRRVKTNPGGWRRGEAGENTRRNRGLKRRQDRGQRLDGRLRLDGSLRLDGELDKRLRLDGELDRRLRLDGELDRRLRLDGELDGRLRLDGELDRRLRLDRELDTRQGCRQDRTGQGNRDKNINWDRN